MVVDVIVVLVPRGAVLPQPIGIRGLLDKVELAVVPLRGCRATPDVARLSLDHDAVRDHRVVVEPQLPRPSVRLDRVSVDRAHYVQGLEAAVLDLDDRVGARTVGVSDQDGLPDADAVDPDALDVDGARLPVERDPVLVRNVIARGRMADFPSDDHDVVATNQLETARDRQRCRRQLDDVVRVVVQTE